MAKQQTDWADFYSPRTVAGWQLPAAIQDDPPNGIFRRLFIRWSELPKAPAAEDGAPMRFLCCDVLELDQDDLLDKATCIFARRIEVTAKGRLILNRTGGNEPDLLLFTQEVVDKATGSAAEVPLVALTPDANGDPTETPYSFRLGDKAIAQGLSWPSDAAQPLIQTPADLEPAYLYEGEPLRLMLVTTFQLATLLSGDNAPLSVAQLKWVASMAGANEDTFDLAQQAGSLANTLLAEKAAGANALLVPRLDNSVYASSAAAFMQLLNERQASWEALQRMKIEDTNWANAARDSLDDRENQKDLADKLLGQAMASRQQALQARSIAAAQVVYEKTQLVECEIMFEGGINRWKEKETRQEIMNMVSGVFDILKQLPVIVAAGPEMAAMPAMQAGQAGLNVLSTVVSTVSADTATKPPTVFGPKTEQEAQAEEQGEGDGDVVFGPKTKEQTEADEKAQSQAEAAKTAGAEAQTKLAEGLASAGEGAKKVVESAMRIAEIAQAAAAMEESSREILSSIGKTVTKVLSSIELQGLDVVTGGSQEWDTLGAAIEDMFENFGSGVLKGIDGGTEYRLEFRKLIIAGKALSQARLALATANSQLAEMKLRSMAAEKAITIVKNRVEQLGAQIGRDETLAQFAFSKVLDAKRAVYLALEAYRRAFLYFTLADETDRAKVPALPRLTDSVDAFSKVVRAIAGKQLVSEALERAPQTGKDVFLTVDAAVLSGLKENQGFVSWVLEPDHTAFDDFGRIRFTGVRVFAEGLKYDGLVEVQVATSGVYTDKPTKGGKLRHFVGEPLRVNFVYDGKTVAGSGSEFSGRVQVDGDIAPRYANDFFNPTPFTTWTLRIKAQGHDEPPLDYDSIKNLDVHLLCEMTPM